MNTTSTSPPRTLDFHIEYTPLTAHGIPDASLAIIQQHIPEWLAFFSAVAVVFDDDLDADIEDFGVMFAEMKRMERFGVEFDPGFARNIANLARLVGCYGSDDPGEVFARDHRGAMEVMA